MSKPLSICFVLCVVALVGCGTDREGEPPAVAAVSISIENQRSAKIYLGGNGYLLQVQTQDGETLKAGPSSSQVTCDACDERCGLAVDPFRIYIELPPTPKKLAEQRHFYRLVEDGCACEGYAALDCYEPASLPVGSHTFEIPFADQIEAAGELTRVPYNDELSALQEQSQMGEAVLPSTQEVQLQYDGGEVALAVE